MFHSRPMMVIRNKGRVLTDTKTDVRAPRKEERFQRRVFGTLSTSLDMRVNTS